MIKECKFRTNQTAFKLKLSLIVLVLIANYSDGFAEIYSPFPVQYLTSNADLVLVGEVVVSQHGEAKIKVERVVKGEWKDENTTASFTQDIVPIDMANIVIAKEYGLFFLRREQEKFFSVDRRRLILPIRRGFDEWKRLDVLSTVRAALLHTAQGPSVFSKEGEKIAQAYHNLPDQYRYSQTFAMYPMNVMAVKYLAEPTYDKYQRVIPSQGRVVEALRNMLPTEDVLLRGALFSTLLTLGQFDMLDSAIKYIDGQERISGESNRAQVARLADDIASAISFVSDEKYTAVLGRLLKHRDVKVRRSAVYALRTISDDVHFFNLTIRYPDRKRDDTVKTPEEIKALRSKLVPLFIMALDDEDQLVRKDAIHGMGGLFVDSPLPPEFLGALESLPKEEVDQQLIVQWKRWWQNQGRNEFEL